MEVVTIATAIATIFFTKALEKSAKSCELISRPQNVKAAVSIQTQIHHYNENLPIRFHQWLQVR
jgi:hypothetical protein